MAGRTKTMAGPVTPANIHERVAGLLALTLTDQLVGLIKTIDGIKGLTNGPNAVKVFDAAVASLGGTGTLTIHAARSGTSASATTRGARKSGRTGGRKKTTHTKTVSAAGREAIRQAQLKRWRKVKRAQKASARGVAKSAKS